MACGGDHDAYASLHQSLYPGLHHYLFKMIRDSDVVDDLLQELFVKLWRKRDRIGTIKSVKSYFFTAARSMAINYFRQIKSQSLRLANFVQPEMEFSAEEIMISGEINTELKTFMVDALNQLPARQREIVYLKYYEEMDYQKIAEVTGIQYQSVINHVFRGLQTLRAGLKQAKNEYLYSF